MKINVKIDENNVICVGFNTDNTKLVIDEFWRSDGYGVKIFAPETAEAIVISTKMMRHLHVSNDVENLVTNSHIGDKLKADAIKLLLLERFEDDLEELVEELG